MDPSTFHTRASLILTGLGIALAFRCGLFNIGGQGQVILGATIAGFLGYALPLPPVVHMLVAAIGGIIGGAIWAGIAGVLKARTGANEVIVTIMLNSIAGYALGYLLKQSWFTHTTSANPQSRVIDDSVKARMKDVLGDIVDGSFAKRFFDDQDAGAPEFRRFREEQEKHPIETTGRELRKMMAWVSDSDDDYVEGTAAR